MGTLSLNHPRLAAPDSPPELVSPSSSTYSSRPSPPADLQSWASSSNGPVSPPMSSYDRNSAVSLPKQGKSAEDVEVRPGSAQSQPRQQLPSLSSLFGPPSSMMPLHSPMSDRPSTYHATSPLDPPRVSPAYSERSYSTSYFPPATPPSTSQPRSLHGTRYDNERPSSLYPLAGHYSGPESPRSREADHHRHDSRYDGHATARWHAPQETPRFEQSMDKPGSGHFRPLQDRYAFHFSGGKEMGASYRDQLPQSTPGHIPPTTPSSHAGSSESVIATDALGPKIWTGTHFLPRFIRAAEVPGEGLCYFYDDGTHCKTVIDGETVNAHWGVTKAGKPRKRLAIACMTCREKKIKCDPDYPRCVQCEKFGRVCKFKNAPRGGHNASPSTPPAETADSRRLGAPPNESEIRAPATDSRSVSPRTHIRLPSPEPPIPHKRLRLGFDSHPSISRTEHSPGAQAPDASKPNLSWQPRPLIELPRIHDDVLHRPWQSDPYVSV